MKKIHVFLILMLSFLSLHAQNVQMIDLANISRYQKQNENMLNIDSRPKVVFIGNSITEGWFSADSAFFIKNQYLNRGIGGQTTSQFLLRFRSDVVNLNPQIVIINGGINDIAENTGRYDESLTFDNIKSMVDICLYNGIEVVLTSVLPATRIPWNEGVKNTAEKVISLNKLIKDYANEKGILYVDYYSEMVNSDKGLRTEYTTEGVHVTPEGYTAMENIIQPKIQSLVLRKGLQ